MSKLRSCMYLIHLMDFRAEEIYYKKDREIAFDYTYLVFNLKLVAFR